MMTRSFPRPHIVVSRCIEFEACRYDGSRIPSRTVEMLLPFADCTPVCPEVAIGLGIPRDTVRLVRIEGADHLIQPATGRDVTEEMVNFTSQFLDGLPPVDGFILKGGSPTSGPKNVRVYPTAKKSMAIDKAPGLFAREVLRRYDDLPVEDELRLQNARIRDHFLTGIFTLASFRVTEALMDPEKLVAFHAANKLLLMACHEDMMRRMGRLVASRAQKSPQDLFEGYRAMLLQALLKVPGYTRNINVLHHAMGHFSERVTKEEKDYCLALIERYRKGQATLAEPRDLLRSWVIRFMDPVLMDQTFFTPYPHELAILPDEVTDRGRNVWNTGGS